MRVRANSATFARHRTAFEFAFECDCDLWLVRGLLSEMRAVVCGTSCLDVVVPITGSGRVWFMLPVLSSDF